LIRGVKFLDDIEEIEWYSDEGKTLVIDVGKGFRDISGIPIAELVYSNRTRSLNLGCTTHSEKIAARNWKILYILYIGH
jgi:hypothetical protein